MRFSIVIPNYNNIKWWERMIKSIESQTYKDYEVIIVDDMSTDGSYKAIAEYLYKKYIEKNINNWHIYQNETKRLNGGTRNVGVAKACGDYIVFMDCDDYFYSSYALESISKEIEKTHADLIRLPYHYLVQCGEGDVPLHEATIPKLMQSLFVAPWTKCVKRELFRPFPEGTLNEDVSQHIDQVDQIESIGYVNQPVIVWNCRNDNAISKHEENPLRRASYWKQIADLEILDLKHDYSKEWKQARLNQYYTIAKERLGIK